MLTHPRSVRQRPFWNLCNVNSISLHSLHTNNQSLVLASCNLPEGLGRRSCSQFIEYRWFNVVPGCQQRSAKTDSFPHQAPIVLRKREFRKETISSLIRRLPTIGHWEDSLLSTNCFFEFYLCGNMKDSSKSALAFSSDATTRKMSLMESIPRNPCPSSRTRRWKIVF